MYPPFYAVCTADAAVVALVAHRIYPAGEVEQGARTPYVAWQVIAGAPENYLGNPPDMDRFMIQVSAYARTAGEARAVAKAIRDAIETHAYVFAWRGEGRETETRLYWYRFDIDWHVPRA